MGSLFGCSEDSSELDSTTAAFFFIFALSFFFLELLPPRMPAALRWSRACISSAKVGLRLIFGFCLTFLFDFFDFKCLPLFLPPFFRISLSRSPRPPPPPPEEGGGGGPPGRPGGAGGPLGGGGGGPPGAGGGGGPGGGGAAMGAGGGGGAGAANPGAAGGGGGGAPGAGGGGGGAPAGGGGAAGANAGGGGAAAVDPPASISIGKLIAALRKEGAMPPALSVSVGRKTTLVAAFNPGS